MRKRTKTRKRQPGINGEWGLVVLGVIFWPFVLWETMYRKKNPPPWDSEDPDVLYENFFSDEPWAEGTLLSLGGETLEEKLRSQRNMIVCQFGNLWTYEANDAVVRLMNDPRIGDYLDQERIDHNLELAERSRKFLDEGWTKKGPPEGYRFEEE